MTEFKEWPKIARLYRPMVVTEKIDGTNAAIGILEDGTIYTQSRTQFITPDNDNHGYARWVQDNTESLISDLGEGLHYGEWWGSGINRGYGLPKGEKRFSLFNTKRWTVNDEPIAFTTPGLTVVPIIGHGIFGTDHVNECLLLLKLTGSLAAEGYMRPEGVVAYHTAANAMFKSTIEGDKEWKGKAA